MSRMMDQDDSEVFRTVVTVQRKQSLETLVFGPYRTLGVAKASVVNERRKYRYHDNPPVIDAHIERAAVVWEPVSPSTLDPKE